MKCLCRRSTVHLQVYGRARCSAYPYEELVLELGRASPRSSDGRVRRAISNVFGSSVFAAMGEANPDLTDRCSRVPSRVQQRPHFRRRRVPHEPELAVQHRRGPERLPAHREHVGGSSS
jgi:hypothetical protein